MDVIMTYAGSVAMMMYVVIVFPGFTIPHRFSY